VSIERGESDMTYDKSREMASLAYHALEEKKAENITMIDIEQVSTLADYFIIASGNNRNQVQAMADEVDEVLGRAGYEVKHKEGYQTANWILLDYGDLVIHIFDTQNRLFYDLDRIWRDGKAVSIEELEEGKKDNVD
jgi:ribosome-associated protein